MILVHTFFPTIALHPKAVNLLRRAKGVRPRNENDDPIVLLFSSAERVINSAECVAVPASDLHWCIEGINPLTPRFTRGWFLDGQI